MKRLLILVATVAVTLVSASAASAATINVNTTDDAYGGSGANCSLREAITSAQTNVAFDGCTSGSGVDTIKIPGGTYKITRAGDAENANVTGDFDVTGTDALSIEPVDNTVKVVVDGNALDRVFDQQGNNSLSLNFLHVTNGRITQIEDGGGIRNATGNLNVDGVTVSGSKSAISAGGIAVYNNLTMVNSTVSGNSAEGNAGGIYVPGGARATVKSSTITANTADSDANDAGDGGGFNDSASDGVDFFNVINAANSDLSPTAANKAPDCYSSSTKFFPRFVVTTQPLPSANCLVGFDPGSNKVVADALIGPLKDNGGQTPTHALLEGSPAIGAGGTAAPDLCPAKDQNGRERPVGGCDIGAVQFFTPEPPPPNDFVTVKIAQVKPKPLILKRGKKAKAVSVTVQNTSPAAAANVKLCLKKPGKAIKKALKIKGKLCRSVGTLVAKKTVKFKLAAKKKAKKKTFKLKATVTADQATPKSAFIKVKVK